MLSEPSFWCCWVQELPSSNILENKNYWLPCTRTDMRRGWVICRTKIKWENYFCGKLDLKKLKQKLSLEQACLLRADHPHRVICCTISIWWLPMKIADRSRSLREPAFAIYFAPVTLTLTLWSTYTNLTYIPCRYIVSATMNFILQGFRKLLSDRQTCIHTDVTKILDDAASDVVKKMSQLLGEECNIQSTIHLQLLQ